MAFLGGTALRIVHGSTRFSEDLDFDNFDLSDAEFIELGEIIKHDLEAEGLEVAISTKTLCLCKQKSNNGKGFF